MPSFCGNDDAAYSMKGDFLGDGKGGFHYLPQSISNLNIPGDTRKIHFLQNGLLLFLRNNDFPLIYKVNR